MKNIVRTLAVNLTVLLALFFGLWFVVSLGGDLVTLGKQTFREGDKKGRHSLPAYSDPARAKLVFKDQKRTVEGYVPYVGWRRLPIASETLNIDAAGLRRHTVGRDNAENAVTLGFFGGSTMWGTGVDDDSTIPALFDAATTAYEVTNNGEGGWTSRQNLAQLINLINQGRGPQVVVFYDGANDVEIGCNLGFGEGFNQNHEAPKLREMVLDSQNRYYLYRNFVVPALATFRRVTGRKGFGTERVCDKDPTHAKRVAETLLRNWEIARTLVEAYGGQFYAVLQPVASVGAPQIDYLDLDANRLAQYPATYPFIRDLMAERGAGWSHDISDTFDGDQKLYIDHAHVVPDGNAMIVQRLRAILQPSDR